MKLTRQHHREARLLWQSILINDLPDPDRLQKVIQTAQTKLGRQSEGVLRCLVQRMETFIRSNQIRVTSVDRLSDTQKKQLTAQLEGDASPGVKVQFFEDASVLGGLRIEQGYLVTDQTLSRQLEILKDLLLRK